MLIAYDVFFIDASSALGFEGVPSETYQPKYDVKVHSDFAWNQILGNAELVPHALRDTVGALRPDEVRRGPYSPDPVSFYGYFGSDPRIDFWWLWVEPTDGSNVTYFLFIPTAGSAAMGLWVARRRSPARRPTIAPVSVH